MGNLLTQFRELAPSAKEPLFRRLMVDESLSYLREKNSIIGFEVDTSCEQELSGFALIAIQKHTIYAYCADLHEPPKLILFPPLEKLFDPAFELLGLRVIKRRFLNAKFTGTKLASGKLEHLVRDLTPPEKEVDVSDMVAEQMAGHMKTVKEKGHVVSANGDKHEEVPVKITKEVPVSEPETFVEEPPEFMDDGFGDTFEDDPYAGFDSAGYEGYDTYDSYEPYEEYEEPEPAPEPEPEPVLEDDPRTVKLMGRDFAKLSDVSDFCSLSLGVPRPLAVNIVNRALQSNVAPEYRVALAVKLFAKLFNEKRI